MIQNKIRDLGTHTKTSGFLGNTGKTWGLLGDSWGNLRKLGVSRGHQNCPKFFQGTGAPQGATVIRNPGAQRAGGVVLL